MKQYAGIDVSLEASYVCVVDAEGKIVREAKVLSEPDALISWFAGHQVAMERIGLEAGPLSQWLYASMSRAGWLAAWSQTKLWLVAVPPDGVMVSASRAPLPSYEAADRPAAASE